MKIDCIQCGRRVEAWFPQQKYCGQLCRNRANVDRNFPKIREQRLKLRMRMIRAYGSKCACCGIKDHWFLNLDHIDNGSRVHKVSHKEWERLEDLGWPKDGYQLLCYNCNFAKRSYGSCPHSWPD